MSYWGKVISISLLVIKVSLKYPQRENLKASMLLVKMAYLKMMEPIILCTSNAKASNLLQEHLNMVLITLMKRPSLCIIPLRQAIFTDYDNKIYYVLPFLMLIFILEIPLSKIPFLCIELLPIINYHT
jgi:hypothetical protein